MTEITEESPPGEGLYQQLDRIFRPRGIAIVGASQDPTKRGNQAIAALQQAGYAGLIHPIHPKGGEVRGLPVHQTVNDAPGECDVALICTPAATVPDVLEQAADRGLTGAVIVGGGFREAGAKGAALEQQMREVIERTGIRVIGPNTSGFLNPHRGVNLIGVPDVPAGRIALIAQSGNMALQLMTEARRRSRAGFSLVVGVGNEGDVRFDEYLEYLADEPNTAVIAMYVEGFRQGRLFLEAAERVTPRKPVVLLKGGRSVRGQAAARSHTGALAGSYPVFRAGLKRSGVLQVRRSDELFHVAETFASQPARGGFRGVAVLTDGGGHGTLAVDALRNFGAPLADLGTATLASLQRDLSLAEPPGNPCDLAGAADADPLAFARAIETMMMDDQVGTVIVVGLFGGYHLRFSAELLGREVAAAKAIIESSRKHRRALVVHSLYANTPSEPLDALRNAGVTVVESLEVAARCAAACSERGEMLSRRRGTPPAARGAHWHGFTAVREQERKMLLETEARDLVAGYALRTVPGTLCKTPEEAEAAIETFGGEAALKVVSGTVSHKTDAGGVRLGVKTAEARRAFAEISDSVRAYSATKGQHPDIRGMLVCAMLPKPIAELIIGFKKDPQYGGVIVVGLGGVAVEVLKDVTLRLLPITRSDARAMLSEIKGSRLLRGHRGQPGVDRDALVDTILAVAACARANPEVLEMEVNPVFAYDHGAVAVDVRVLL